MVGRDLVHDRNDEQRGLGFDPDILLFEEFCGNDLASFADRFDWHADAFRRRIEFVSGAVDTTCGRGDVVLLRDLSDPADDIFLPQ
mgnify:CR=1 FL=1